MRKLLLIALALAGILSLSLTPANASSVSVCAPEQPGVAAGPRQVKAVTSGTTYGLNNRGCALIANADLGDFQAMGFAVNAGLSPIVAVTGVLSGTTSVQIATLPPSAYIAHILIENSTANAVTGGINLGKTTGAADIVSAKACAASCLTSVLDSAILLRNFSTTASQAIWLTAQTAGNSANLNVTIIYGYF